MQEQLSILNSRELKSIRARLHEQYGIEKVPTPLLRSGRGRIYLASEALADLDTEGLRISSVGVYIATEHRDGSLRLSIEGSQLLGPHARRNVIEVDKEQLTQWLQGEDLEIAAESGFVIIRCDEDYAGCGMSKEGRIRNHVPKQRRIRGTPFADQQTSRS